MFNLNYKTQKYIILITFLLVPLTLLMTFSYYPAVNLFYISFTSWDGLDAHKHWIGLANYIELLSSPDIFKVFSHNLAYFIVGISQNIAALLFAIILNTKLKGRYFFRVILFLPFIINSVAVAFMFGYMYDSQHGAFNMIIQSLGLGNYTQRWLGNEHIVNYSLAFVNMWKYMGFNMVIYLAGIQSIPDDLYEAAKIDGATSFQTIRFITIPNLKKIIELSMFLILIGALEAFDLPFILTKGGPLGASETFVTKTIDTAFQFSNFGLASAMGVILMVIVIILITIQKKVLFREED